MSTLTSTRFGNPRSLLLLAVFLAVVIGVGAFIGTNTAPGEWYASLEKPPFNPPNWVFGPVWFTLYVLIAFAGWRVAVAAPSSAAMGLWVGQMILNWMWSPVWFTLNQTWAAFGIIVLMLATILAFIWRTWPMDRLASLAFVPYAAWVSFATVLNLSIALLN